MGLEEYRNKRDFSRTAEPSGAREKTGEAGVFVVQKHAARRLHYDFRLEMGGVLKSWAVTKGPSYDPAEKRLAVETEDHPLEYGAFEGTIPKGEYGGGTVMLWDRGRWQPIGDPEEGYRKGKLHFRLEGEKLHGGWALVRMHGRSERDSTKRNWLLIKERDDEAAPDRDILAEAPHSVTTGRDLDDIAEERPPIKTAEPLPARQDLALCSLVEQPPEGEDWLHEIKFDGYRLLLRIAEQDIRLITRNGKDWTEKFKPLARAAEELRARQAMIDGEVVVLQPGGASDFGLLQEALSRGDTRQVVFMAFDLLHLDGRDLRGLPLEQRKAMLQSLLDKAPNTIRYSDHIFGKGPDFLRRACEMGLEGAVSKRRNSPYRPGRGKAWLKSKCLQRQEFVILGFTKPQGGRKGFGALLLGYHQDGKLVYAGKVGTGFSNKMLDDLTQQLEKRRRKTKAVAGDVKESGVTWVRPDLVAEVSFFEWTRDGHLRHPAFQGLRSDKPAAEITREQPDTQPAGNAPQRLAQYRLSNADKLLYPEQGVTKGGLAEYYLLAADWILPLVIDRPLTLVRCPQGWSQKCFSQRHAGVGTGKAVQKVEVPGDDKPHMFIRDLDGLMALVQMGVLEIHTWGSRIEAIERADRLVFDLDPAEDLPWPRVAEAAFSLRDRLAGLGLQSWVKTTGGKGLHLVLPLKPELEWDRIKTFAKAFAEKMAQDEPRLYTANMAKAKRQGRIFIDYLRNQRAATFVAPYSTRAKPRAPVAAPITWEELESGIRSDHFTLETMPRRLAALKSDPWADLAGTRQRIAAGALKALGLK